MTPLLFFRSRIISLRLARHLLRFGGAVVLAVLVTGGVWIVLRGIG